MVPKFAHSAARPPAEPVGRKYTRQNFLAALINQEDGLLKSWPPGVAPIIIEYVPDEDCMRINNIHDDLVTLINDLNKKRKDRLLSGYTVAADASLELPVPINTPITSLLFKGINDTPYRGYLKCRLFNDRTDTVRIYGLEGLESSCFYFTIMI